MQIQTNPDVFKELSRSPREFSLHTTLKKAAGHPSLAAFAIYTYPETSHSTVANETFH